jgi:hypothetical protein
MAPKPPPTTLPLEIDKLDTCSSVQFTSSLAQQILAVEVHTNSNVAKPKPAFQV